MFFRQMFLSTTTTMSLPQLMQKRMERTTSLTLGSVPELGDAKPASEGFREKVTQLLETVWKFKRSNVNTARRLSARIIKYLSAKIVLPNSQSEIMMMITMILNKLITFFENGFISIIDNTWKMIAVTQRKWKLLIEICLFELYIV